MRGVTCDSAVESWLSKAALPGWLSEKPASQTCFLAALGRRLCAGAAVPQRPQRPQVSLQRCIFRSWSGGLLEFLGRPGPSCPSRGCGWSPRNASVLAVMQAFWAFREDASPDRSPAVHGENLQDVIGGSAVRQAGRHTQVCGTTGLSSGSLSGWVAGKRRGGLPPAKAALRGPWIFRCMSFGARGID